MFIVMHCGGIPFNGDTLKTKSLGGSETAAYYVAKELVKLGHSVTLFTNSQDTGKFDGVKYEWMGDISEAAPLGNRFTFYAENTLHDICIIQRSLHAFERKWASKINLWWLHDLSFVRQKVAVQAQMWNVDRIMCVSEWHKAQVVKAWGVDKDSVAVLRNGVDLELFSGEIDFVVKSENETQKPLLYSSRPERGLIHLVGEGGIMEKLAVVAPDYHLYVCGYENTTSEMAQFYKFLYDRCEKLPNVTRLGALTKKELADVMRQCYAHIYPTDFDEVSCITAMEAMAAGLPMVSSAHAALTETCKDAGVLLIPLADGKVNIPRIVAKLKDGVQHYAKLQAAQLKSAQSKTWDISATSLIETVQGIFSTAKVLSLAHHFMRHSDIVPFVAVLGEGNAVVDGVNCLATSWGQLLGNKLIEEYRLGYGFYRHNTYAAHYAAYYQYEKERGVVYGPEDVTHTTRFQTVANRVGVLPAGSRVLDYGCAHGHYTVALAKLFPHLSFVGADLAQSNIDTATKWAVDEGLTNIGFVQVNEVHEIAALCDENNFDLIIAAEVVEHVGNPQELIDTLASFLTDVGRMVITTPYGPWEAQGYREHKYWRAHLHHFERQDLADMLGHHPDYSIVAAPSGRSMFDSVLGSFITTFTKPTESSYPINYNRKIRETMPDQTLSACLIVRDAEQDIQRCMESILPFVQEVIIRIDPYTRDNTIRILDRIVEDNPLVAFHIFVGDEPISEIGFAAARNETIDKASCDWVLWIDSDEVLTNGNQLPHYLRNNQFNGFAIKQHHFSTVPMAVIKVDLPCRIFRNGKGIQFFGCVHEHPEIKMNDGLGQVMLLGGVEIAHYGYKNDAVRKQRFSRNLSLLERDRKELPERMLGKFLWIRDLAQMCQYDIEDKCANPVVFAARADEGIKLWEELLASGNMRITVDALGFYSTLVQIKGGGFDFGFSVDASKLNGGVHVDRAPIIQGHFLNKSHVAKLMLSIADDKLTDFDSKYF